MTAKPHDARARIAEARRQQQNAELNAIMDEVDAELAESRREREATKPAVPEITAEEKRRIAKQEAINIANSITINGRTGIQPAAIGDDSSAKEIADNIQVGGRYGGRKPQMKKAARYIDARDR